MQMSVKGLGELERFRVKLARDREKVLKPSIASGADKGARAIRKSTYDMAKKTTGLPARVLGRRLYTSRADRRKPIDKVGANVSVYHGRKVSASYRDPDTKMLMAKTAGRGAKNVKLGRKVFTGAWISKAKGRNRQFVGMRIGKSSTPFIAPSVDLKPVGKYMEKLRGKGLVIMEREVLRQIDIRLAKLVSKHG